jgi:hypothetical protein
VEVGAQALPLCHTVEQFEGRFRPLSVLQLCLAWWLYREGHLTRRQLRVFFALQEMAERRRYTKADPRGKKRDARYTPEELAALVGGRDHPPAEAHLRGDVRRLQAVGLVRMSQTRLVFASSPDQINVDDLAGFWDFWDQVPNRRRSVPVPRRTLRALAAGFSRATTGVLIALMIRSLHWHKREGEYRVDGRTKGSWISEVFGISRRAVTDGRAHLIELGWIEPLETSQTLLNRYGQHDRINVDWSPEEASAGDEGATGSASPSLTIGSVSATPIRNRNLPSYRRNLKNNKPDEASSGSRLVGGRKREGGAAGALRLRAMPSGCLGKVESVLELHREAVAAGLSDDSESGVLRFVALAERARSRGDRPEALFAWLLRNQKFEYVTQADEDNANRRLKAHRYPAAPRAVDDARPAENAQLSQADQLVRICCQIARQKGLRDPFVLARKIKGWKRAQWDEAKAAYELRFGASG